jgi:phospholipid-binding lipoprotein MlaA
MRVSSTSRRRGAAIALGVSLLAWSAAPFAAAQERSPQLRFATILDRRPDGVAAPVPANAEELPESPTVYDQLGDAMSAIVDSAGAAMRPLAETLTGPEARQSYDDAMALARDLAATVQHTVVDPILALVVAPDAEQDAVAEREPPEDRRLAAMLAAGPSMRDARLVQYDDALRAAIDADDPLEEFNRVMFGMNDRLRNRILYPVTHFYLQVTSPPVQQGVRNFFANLREPVTIASSLLEGQFAAAGTATARFGINTTIGLIGIMDPATAMGYRANPRDLEEALCVHGVPAGPYLVLPLFGPGTIRDAAGRIATVIAYYEAMGSTLYVPYRITDIAVRSIDVQGQLDRLNATSLDPYVAQRVLVLSARALDCGRQSEVGREYFHK